MRLVFSLHDKVRVKLTRFGMAHLKRKGEEKLQVAPGVVETELWHLMSVFGIR